SSDPSCCSGSWDSCYRCFCFLLHNTASILSSCFLLTQAQGKTEIHITVDPNELREGQSVTLTPGSVDLKPYRGCTWFRGTLENKNRIFTYARIPFEDRLNGPAFTGRETVDSLCSLRITLLRLNDSGMYTLTVGLPVIYKTGNANLTVLGMNLQFFSAGGWSTVPQTLWRARLFVLEGDEQIPMPYK
uniref:Immunoglobulin domain-containing protein n=1 Tax=Podarcis muralis TaxID=64176 RepID=A0A670ISW7_PODMU